MLLCQLVQIELYRITALGLWWPHAVVQHQIQTPRIERVPRSSSQTVLADNRALTKKTVFCIAGLITRPTHWSTLRSCCDRLDGCLEWFLFPNGLALGSHAIQTVFISVIRHMLPLRPSITGSNTGRVPSVRAIGPLYVCVWRLRDDILEESWRQCQWFESRWALINFSHEMYHD